MSSLAKLKAAASLKDLADLLGFKPSKLSYIVYHIHTSAKYTEFEIPKRSGGKRKIKAPEPRLKTLQRRLANLLYLCVAEIERTPPVRKPLSHGFSRSRSIITNASRHRKRRFVFNIDIQDFFPSINFGRVRGFFLKDNNFTLHPSVATVIAQIACHNNELPQGSPCSPVISNLVGNLLDNRLVGIAKANKCTYSRYADDITFSTSQSTFPAAIAMPDASATGGWQVGPALSAGVYRSGFKINSLKTRMQVRGSRQLTTGLLVNEKPNIRPEYYRTVRSMCAALFTSGSYYQLVPATMCGGTTKDAPTKALTTSLAPLEGMLSHIYQVRNSVDQRSSTEKKKAPTATRKLYQRFLHYKNFVALERPLLVTEGKTDQIYLRAAIEKLPAFHPRLGSFSGGKFNLAVRFMKYTTTLHDVLQLGGGSGDLKFLMLHHKEMLERFKHAPLLNPVILVIDNDDGANEIFGVAKQICGSTISHSSTDPFYKIHKNLYLIKTPSLTAKPKTCIEDLFDISVRSILIDGKGFDPNKKHGDDTKYGKARFAEKIVQPNKDKIDFSAFDSILDGIVGAIDDYAP